MRWSVWMSLTLLACGTASSPESQIVTLDEAPAPMAHREVAAEPPMEQVSDRGGSLGEMRRAPRATETAAKAAPIRERPKKDRKPAQVAPRLNFGGSTYLSNDDSMSLASAQRLLWSLDNNAPIHPSEVRPHELLNYFSFDTETPAPGSTFEVTASAQIEDDTMSVAFAVQGAQPDTQPLDLTVLIDKSCSMEEAGRIAYTKRALDQMVGQLNPGDRVDVVLFSDHANTVLDSYVVQPGSNEALRDTFASIRPRGGTNLGAGLEEAYAVASRKTGTHRRNRRVMVFTDAKLNQGQVNKSVLATVGKRLENDGIRLTGVGVGRDFDDGVLDKLTEQGKGAYVYLGSEAVVDRLFTTEFSALTQTLAHDVRFRMHLPKSLALSRFYGEAASTEKSDIDPIHYYAGTSQVFLQDLKIHPSIVPTDAIALEVTWTDARTGEPESRRFSTTVGAMLNGDTHNVLKARTLMAWTDVVSAKASHADPSAACDTFHQRARGLADPEITYVKNLIGSTCRQGNVAIRR